MTDNVQETKDILGYGEELKVLVGVDKDSNEKIIKNYHFTPVALKDIPLLMKKLNVFFKSSEKSDWSEEAIKRSSEIIKMALIKMHPEVSDEEIQKNFGLGALAKGVSIVMDINDFLSQMQVMTQMLTKVQPNLKKSQD